MAIHESKEHIPSAPTDASIFYPEEDGEPMAVSDLHRRILMRTLQAFDEHFKQYPDVYVSGDILLYYVEGDPRKSVSPDVLVAFGLGKKARPNYLVWEEGKVPDFAMEFSSKNTYRNDLGRKMELYASLGIQDYFLCDIEGLYLPSPLMGFTLVDGLYVQISENVDGGLHSPALNLDFHIGDVGRWLHTATPNLDFPAEIMGLGIYDPVEEAWLQTPAESALARAEAAEARAEQAAARAETAEAHAEQAAARVETAEAHAEQAAAHAEAAEAHAEQAAARAETAEARAEEEVIARQQAAARAETAEAEAARLRAELERLQARSN